MAIADSSLVAIKSAQAVNFFLQESQVDPQSKDGNKYLKLIKLLWATDRFSLRNFGCTVTDDNYCAMSYGPVVSRTYDLIKACDTEASHESKYLNNCDINLWQNTFERRSDYTLKVINDPGQNYLSPADLMMLEEAYSKFRTMEQFKVANDISHYYPEWEKFSTRLKNQRTSFKIKIEDFFSDPTNYADHYFQVDTETLKASKLLFEERKRLSAEIRISL